MIEDAAGECDATEIPEDVALWLELDARGASHDDAGLRCRSARGTTMRSLIGHGTSYERERRRVGRRPESAQHLAHELPAGGLTCRIIARGPVCSMCLVSGARAGSAESVYRKELQNQCHELCGSLESQSMT